MNYSNSKSKHLERAFQLYATSCSLQAYQRISLWIFAVHRLAVFNTNPSWSSRTAQQRSLRPIHRRSSPSLLPRIQHHNQKMRKRAQSHHLSRFRHPAAKPAHPELLSPPPRLLLQQLDQSQARPRAQKHQSSTSSLMPDPFYHSLPSATSLPTSTPPRKSSQSCATRKLESTGSVFYLAGWISKSRRRRQMLWPEVS